MDNKEFREGLDTVLYFDYNISENASTIQAKLFKQLILDLIAETIKTAEILPCSDKGHDDRWCYACECRKDGINDFGMQLKQIVEGK